MGLREEWAEQEQERQSANEERARLREVTRLSSSRMCCRVQPVPFSYALKYEAPLRSRTAPVAHIASGDARK